MDKDILLLVFYVNYDAQDFEERLLIVIIFIISIIPIITLTFLP